MYTIELKFYDNYWRNYFSNKSYSYDRAIILFNQLIKYYPDRKWRLTYIGN